MNYPEYVRIEGKLYKINSDFRVAIECQEIATNINISDYERSLAIIYKLFGDEGINTPKHYEKLLELGIKYLSCGKEIIDTNEEPDMDFSQDIDLIRISFMAEYNGLDIKNISMHWWEFYNRINGLSNSEMGNCCLLNKVRNIRSFDEKDINDPKQLQQIRNAKKQVALKKKEIKNELTNEQQKNIENYYKMTGIIRKE